MMSTSYRVSMAFRLVYTAKLAQAFSLELVQLSQSFVGKRSRRLHRQGRGLETIAKAVAVILDGSRPTSEAGHTRDGDGDGRSGLDENTACGFPSCGHSFNRTAMDKVVSLGHVSRLPGDGGDRRRTS
jgi:hypothetical protein